MIRGSSLRYWIEQSCDYLLDPSDPLFAKVAALFLQHQREVFGGDTGGGMYNCDTFNEMTPPSGDPGYLRDASAAVYDPIRSEDPGGTWVMQAWLFHRNMSPFWTNDTVRWYLGGVPDTGMLILDLNSETGALA